MNQVVKQVAPILVEVMLFQGVYLLTPESSKWRRPIAVGLILAAVAIAFVLYGPVLSAPIVSLPSPLPFIAVALLASALAAGLHRYRDKVLLSRSALALADRLDDFAQICRARIGSRFSLSHADQEIQQRKLRDDYVTSFATDIRRVHRALTAHNEAFADLLDTMLGSNPDPNPTFKMPGLATWVAKTLRLEATLLQRERPWTDLGLFLTFGTYLAFAALLWVLLLLMAHK